MELIKKTEEKQFAEPQNGVLKLISDWLANPLRFVIEHKGDSMINAFVPPNAKLLVDSSVQPQNGDIVVAELAGKYSVKFLKKNDHKAWLIPANSKYSDIEITSLKEVRILGVVIAVLPIQRNY